MLYDRVGRFDLTLLVLQLDVVMWLFTMHHVGATWFMTGLTWFVQIVHYPLMGVESTSGPFSDPALTWGRHLDTRIGTGSLG